VFSVKLGLNPNSFRILITGIQMTKYSLPRLRTKPALSERSEELVSDLILSIVGQIRVFEGKNCRPGAVYGISRSVRMLHEVFFEAGYTREAKEYLVGLGFETKPRTIREVYILNRKIDKDNRQLYAEHTDGGVRKLTVDLLGLFGTFKGDKDDVSIVRKHIIENTYFIIKHKEKNKDINENYSLKLN